MEEQEQALTTAKAQEPLVQSATAPEQEESEAKAPKHPTVRSVCRLYTDVHILIIGPINNGVYPALETAGFAPMYVHPTDISEVLGEVDLRMAMQKGATGA